MIRVGTIAEIRHAIAPHRQRDVVAFVPTMGALHEGHAALIRAARAESSCVVVSVFVNPTQFTDPGDLAAYPRQDAADDRIARAAGAQYLFAPSADEMYPSSFATTVDVGGAARGFESDFRPGHFQGVATVCVKLFSIVQPQLVFLGQKDAQQVAVLRQVVRDLNLDLSLRIVATVRDDGGLALSSRNARLSPHDRATAAAIPRALQAGLSAYEDGRDPAAAARAALAGLGVEYVDVAEFDGEPTLVIAARAGATRLIDNVPLKHPALAGLPRRRSTDEVRHG